MKVMGKEVVMKILMVFLIMVKLIFANMEGRIKFFLYVLIIVDCCDFDYIISFC